ncbi:MAG: phosphatidylglycerophosphatase A [Candidatus Omnitrophota bacterium]
MKILTRLLATFFYVGYVPVAPGTAATVAALLLYIIVCQNFALLVVTSLLVGLAGFLTAGRFERMVGQKDPQEVVIDEVFGFFVAFILVPVASIDGVMLLVGFLVFRLLDIFKPFPVRRVERLAGSWGIMLDDVVCGFYTSGLLWIFLVLTHRGSF